jgi:hypothetical protein
VVSSIFLSGSSNWSRPQAPDFEGKSRASIESNGSIGCLSTLEQPDNLDSRERAQKKSSNKDYRLLHNVLHSRSLVATVQAVSSTKIFYCISAMQRNPDVGCSCMTCLISVNLNLPTHNQGRHCLNISQHRLSIIFTPSNCSPHNSRESSCSISEESKACSYPT